MSELLLMPRCIWVMSSLRAMAAASMDDCKRAWTAPRKKCAEPWEVDLATA